MPVIRDLPEMGATRIAELLAVDPEGTVAKGVRAFLEGEALAAVQMALNADRSAPAGRAAAMQWLEQAEALTNARAKLMNVMETTRRQELENRVREDARLRAEKDAEAQRRARHGGEAQDGKELRIGGQ